MVWRYINKNSEVIMSNNTDNNMQEIKPDIFDKIMHLPGLRVFEPLYKK